MKGLLTVTRPSANFDQKMLKAGLRIMMHEGSQGLTVRNICKHAKANLGMFTYCFKDKENYIRILHTHMHDRLMEFIDMDSVKGKTSIERLRHMLIRTAQFTERDRMLSAALLFDGLINYDTYRENVKKGLIPVKNDLFPLIQEARKDGYISDKYPITQIFPIIIFGGIMPEIFQPRLKDLVEIHKLPKSELKQRSFITQRIDIILKGLRPQ